MNRGNRWAAAVAGAATVAAALSPLVLGREETPIATHHVYHAFMLAGGAIAGLLLAPSAGAARESPAWMLAVVGAPLLAMLLMWPSEYGALDARPLFHAAAHVGLAILGFLVAYGGQRYSPGIGKVMGALTVLIAFVAAFGYGIAPPR